MGIQNEPTLWAQILIFVTTLVGFIYQAWRDERNRRWLKEDAKAKQEVIVAKIEENTEISVKAFEVGNHVNEKFLALTEKFDSLSIKETAREARRLERIDDTTQETNERVRELASE